MTKALRLLLLPLFILISQNIDAQHYRYLALEKKGRINKIKIYPGEYIRLRFSGEKRFYQRKIIDFADPYIILTDSRINIKAIAEIDITSKQKKPPLLDGLGQYLPIAGAGYFAVDMVNRTIVNGQSLSIDQKVLTSSLVMIGAGLLFRRIGKKRFKIKPGNRIRIVNLSPNKN